MTASQAASPDSRGAPTDRSAWSASVDERLFRRVMGLFATGITVITTEVDGGTHGMTANAFMAGSLEPPLCVISVGNGARLRTQLRTSGRFGVSFLSQQQRHLSNHFAGRRLASVQPEFARLDGVPVLARSHAAVAAEIFDTTACGDHTLFIGRILRLEAGSGRPLLFHGGRYARVDDDDPIVGIDPPGFW